ncbi:DUF3325 domain-containing protein [Acinetobacter sp. A47]|uniref:DUF3325 domain-containing protein n=1 Tax=Acinetobacter sp. A47 TaxID=1561217 RepID=UPI00056F0E39|nr:DUF3325 domain-containing protein [Acinetobacter sp. A47]
MTAWILWCLAVMGLSSLACAMNKHQRDIFTMQVCARHTQLFQCAGWGILLFSVMLAMCWKGPSLGGSIWLGCISFAAMAVALVLSYRPRKIFHANALVAMLLGLFVFIGWR